MGLNPIRWTGMQKKVRHNSVRCAEDSRELLSVPSPPPPPTPDTFSADLIIYTHPASAWLINVCIFSGQYRHNYNF